MPHPKYVIAMGACMITGGMFSSDSPTTVRGADKLLPIDVYIPGCPPRPEAVMDAIIKLRKKVANEDIRERDQMLPTHRYYSTTHRMKPVPQTHTGLYLESPTRQQAPKELVEQMGMPVVPALKPEAEKVT
jgi:NAD(P)H-quinone oxidoreductase subunit K